MTFSPILMLSALYMEQARVSVVVSCIVHAFLASTDSYRFLSCLVILNQNPTLRPTSLTPALDPYFLSDDRPEFKGLHSVFIGPHLLVGLTEEDNRLPPSAFPSSPSSFITPLPPSTNSHLISITFSTRALLKGSEFGKPGARTFAVAVNYAGAVEIVEEPEKGTQEALFATFRVTAPIQDFLAKSEPKVEGNKNGFVPGVSLPSSFGNDGTRDTPKTILLTVEDAFSALGSVLSRTPRRMLHVGDWDNSKGWEALVGIPFSLEVAGRPGKFVFVSSEGSLASMSKEKLEGITRSAVFQIAAYPSDVNKALLRLADDTQRVLQFSSKDGVPTLKFQVLGDNEVSPLALELIQGVRQYHPLAYMANGLKSNFILEPISAMMDEMYTSYFNFTSLY